MLKDQIRQLETDGGEITLFWTPGHTDIQGNEVADKLAQEATEEAQELDNSMSVMTNQDIKKAAR